MQKKNWFVTVTMQIWLFFLKLIDISSRGFKINQMISLLCDDDDGIYLIA
jgi:hypothetical protein